MGHWCGTRGPLLIVALLVDVTLAVKKGDQTLDPRSLRIRRAKYYADICGVSLPTEKYDGSPSRHCRDGTSLLLGLRKIVTLAGPVIMGGRAQEVWAKPFWLSRALKRSLKVESTGRSTCGEHPRSLQGVNEPGRSLPDQ